ncbi:MAG: GDYXXLXY domain-containing protein [Planctomycetes bacterium]|nr:GDYXXLXY domain-containing protein [Planctomycetota bacterium]
MDKFTYQQYCITACAIVLLLINYSIYQREQHIAHGQTVYVQLAPVDPRSLMQGDYMALDFAIARLVRNALPKKQRDHSWRRSIDASDGYVVVAIDEQQRACYVAIHDDQQLEEGQLLLRYRVRNGTVKFATNAFFFQEGHAMIYEDADFGKFKVDSSGELLLVAMCDENLKELATQ